MTLDMQWFYKACQPSNNEQHYQLDYSPVRGARVIGAMKETICRAASGEATCQLFAGYIGTGKTTELFHLKTELEQELFHVVYFDAREDLDLADVDVGMLMLAIAYRITQSLQALDIKLPEQFCYHLLSAISQLPETSATVSGLSKLIPALKTNSQLRNHLRQVLATCNYNLVDALNEELLVDAIALLNSQGKKGLVVIIDGLDRLDNPRNPRGNLQYETLFIERAHQLQQLKCHIIYTFPVALVFCDKYAVLKQRFSTPPILLPLIPVQHRDGSDCEHGMALLRQMILVRACPELAPEERLSQVTEVFDSLETLDRLCRMSGGNVRMLRSMLYRCLQEEEPPLSRNCVEAIIRESRNGLVDAVDDGEWELLVRVAQEHSLTEVAAEQVLRRARFVLEYEDDRGRWFNVNPLLLETERLRALIGEIHPI
ncbi:MAG: ATP-binding protein [Coleofasciculus sp. S288]|nr:ATP-binding protein [Coleofasciculus sp. S288]